MSHIYITTFNTNPNIGLYMFSTDSYCLIGQEVPEKHRQGIEEALGVPTYRLTVAGTSLIGVFAAGTDNLLLLPDILLEHEKRQLESLNIPYAFFKTNNTALGNNILFNEHGCLVNPIYSENEQKELKRLIGLEPQVRRIANVETPGSIITFNNELGLLHNDATVEDINAVSDLFNRECTNATINMGVPYIKSGLCCNKNGFVISATSSGPEIAFVDEYLGYTQKK